MIKVDQGLKDGYWPHLLMLPSQKNPKKIFSKKMFFFLKSPPGRSKMSWRSTVDCRWSTVDLVSWSLIPTRLIGMQIAEYRFDQVIVSNFKQLLELPYLESWKFYFAQIMSVSCMQQSILI